MLEAVLAAACIISALAYMACQQFRIDEHRREAETWRRRYMEAYTRDMTDAIEADMNRHELLPRQYP